MPTRPAALTAHHVKGTDLVAIRGMLIRSGEHTYAACLEALDAETAGVLRRVMPVQWVPSDTAAEIMECAAELLFPERRDNLEHLGRACADEAFSGIYKAFLRVASIVFLLKRVPRLWSMYHNQGEARLEDVDPRRGGRLVVAGAPAINPSNLRLITGFGVRALELAGAGRPACRLSLENPQRWVWTFTWSA